MVANPPSTSNVDSFGKDLEVQSIRPGASNNNDLQYDTDIEDGERIDVGKDDVEAGTGNGKSKEWDSQTEKERRRGRGVAAVLSRISTRTSIVGDPGPPPDGGWVGWKQAALSHLVIMNTWGFINSFGVFQTYYVTALNRAPADISWVGSMQVFLLFFIGTFTGRLTDAGYFVPVFLFGSFLGVFGHFMASLSTQYWQLFLAQGVCVGLGNGCLFCPSLSVLSTYFTKRRSLALGIGAAGSATGGMIFPAMVQQLLPRIGFAWTLRSLGFIQLACLIICNLGIKPRVPPRKSGALVDWKSFKEPTYVLFAAGMFFNFWGVYFAFYYLGSFARTKIGLPYAESVNLLITLNGVGIIGRLLPNQIADQYLGPMNTLIPVALFSSVVTFAWTGVHSRGGLYGWAVVYGMMGAGIQSLFPAVLSSLTTDPRMQGTRMGMVFSMVSFATLTGPPISGVLIQKGGGSYKYAQIFSGADMLIGCLLLCAARLMKSRELKVKM